MIFLFICIQELKKLRKNDINDQSSAGNGIGGSSELDPAQLKLEFNLLQRKYEILDEREKLLQKLVFNAKKKKASKDLATFLDDLNEILNSKVKK